MNQNLYQLKLSNMHHISEIILSQYSHYLSEEQKDKMKLSIKKI